MYNIVSRHSWSTAFATISTSFSLDKSALVHSPTGVAERDMESRRSHRPIKCLATASPTPRFAPVTTIVLEDTTILFPSCLAVKKTCVLTSVDFNSDRGI